MASIKGHHGILKILQIALFRNVFQKRQQCFDPSWSSLTRYELDRVTIEMSHSNSFTYKGGSVAERPSGQRVGLAIRRSQVRVPLWPLAGFVFGRPEFKFSATLVNSQLVAFCQLGFLILLCCIWIIFHLKRNGNMKERKCDNRNVAETWRKRIPSMEN